MKRSKIGGISWKRIWKAWGGWKSGNVAEGERVE